MPLRHEGLVAWQRADDLFVEIHAIVGKHFPPAERFELASQVRRAAYSVAANIVEGFTRRSLKERAHFLNISEASLAEVGYCLHVAKRLGYLDEATYTRLDVQVRRTAAPLVGLIRNGH
jgi:four helix bundle protein